MLAKSQEQPYRLQKSFEYTIVMDEIYKTYPHNPPHYFVTNAMYIVTGSLLYKQRLLIDDKRKSIVCEILFERAEHLGWNWRLGQFSKITIILSPVLPKTHSH